MIIWDKLFRALTGQPEPDHLTDFDNQTELEGWYNAHKSQNLGPGNLCDDYSREARRLAEEDGKFLSCCLVHDGKVYFTQVWPESEVDDHIANMAIVNHGKSGNAECWFVDLNWNRLEKLCDFTPGGKYI